MHDLIIRNVSLCDGRSGQDVLIGAGRIVAVGPALDAQATRTLDGAGCLLSPPFVDAHFHMDSTLTYGMPRVNESGTLLEGIALVGRAEADARAGCDRRARARAIATGPSRKGCSRSARTSTCATRGCWPSRRCCDVRERVKPYLDLQLVAFPQDGVLRSAGHARQPAPRARARRRRRRRHSAFRAHDGRRRRKRAHPLRTRGRRRATRRHALRRDRRPACRGTSRRSRTGRSGSGLQGRVTGSHLTSMHSMDNYYVSKLIPLIREAQVSAVANPLINITIQGRHDTYPKRRGMTRVPELHRRRRHGRVRPRLRDGSVVCARQRRHARSRVDGPARRADDERGRHARRFDAVTTSPAQILHLDGYGIAPGCRADCVLLQARDPIEAIRLRAARLAVIRGGAVIAESPPATASLHVAGRPASVDWNLRPM